jgi:hypothetical protein
MIPKQNMSKVTITAKHMAYGLVEFSLEATDAKAAFETWKQIVFSPRQWVVTHNSGAWAEAKQDAKRESLPVLDDESDLSLVDEI